MRKKKFSKNCGYVVSISNRLINWEDDCFHHWGKYQIDFSKIDRFKFHIFHIFMHEMFYYKNVFIRDCLFKIEKCIFKTHKNQKYRQPRFFFKKKFFALGDKNEVKEVRVGERKSENGEKTN